MKTLVATPSNTFAVAVMPVSENTEDDIREFVGEDLFYKDGDTLYVTYVKDGLKNGIGVITKLVPDHHIIKLGTRIKEVLSRTQFLKKYNHEECN